MRKHSFMMLIAASMLFVLAGTAVAKHVTVTIPMMDIRVKSTELGSYYFVEVDPPAELAGKRLDSVFFEFVVDVIPASPENDWMSSRVGVFPLTEPFAGENLAYTTDVPSVRTVPKGQSQAVMTEITDIVRRWLSGASPNHGLVIGSLTGPEVGTVSLNDSALGPASAVRVTFFYQNRFGGRLSTK